MEELLRALENTTFVDPLYTESWLRSGSLLPVPIQTHNHQVLPWLCRALGGVRGVRQVEGGGRAELHHGPQRCEWYPPIRRILFVCHADIFRAIHDMCLGCLCHLVAVTEKYDWKANLRHLRQCVWVEPIKFSPVLRSLKVDQTTMFKHWHSYLSLKETRLTSSHNLSGSTYYRWIAVPTYRFNNQSQKPSDLFV